MSRSLKQMEQSTRTSQALAKKIRALRGAILKRIPLRKVQVWAETDAIFQRTTPVALHDMGVEDNPKLAFLRGAVNQDLLREVTVRDRRSSIKLHAWFLPPKNQMLTVIYSYGNSSNLAEAKYLMESFGKRGVGFLGWSYPGYEHSEGGPSEQSLSRGLESVSEYLASEHEIGPTHQIAVGHSLGGLVTVDVAQRISFKLIVLIATPPSLPDYYEHLLEEAPALIRSLCLPKEDIDQRFDAFTKITSIGTPVMFIYFDNDKEIPPSMARKLVNRSSTPNYELLLNGVDHDAILDSHIAEDICNAVTVKAKELTKLAGKE